MKTNIIIDGNHLYHKSYHVFKSWYKEDIEKVLKNKADRAKLKDKFITDFCSVMSNFNSVNRVIVTMDSWSWRKKVYPDYKFGLTRSKEEWYDDFVSIFKEIMKTFTKRGIITTYVENCEGDDLIAVWASYFDAYDENTVIITGDADMRQLVTEKTSVFDNNPKGANIYCHEDTTDYWYKYFDRPFEKFVNITPIDGDEILLKKVFLGDKSDNISSVKKGIGEAWFSKHFLNFKEVINKSKNIPINKLDSSGVIADMLCEEFCKEFSHETDAGELYETYRYKIDFNLKLVWLNFVIYNENGLLDKILSEIIDKKDKYFYKKPFKKEFLTNSLIK